MLLLEGKLLMSLLHTVLGFLASLTLMFTSFSSCSLHFSTANVSVS